MNGEKSRLFNGVMPYINEACSLENTFRLGGGNGVLSTQFATIQTRVLVA